MIRKVITVLLATASCVIGAAWVASSSYRLTCTVESEDRDRHFEFKIQDGYLGGAYVVVGRIPSYEWPSDARYFALLAEFKQVQSNIVSPRTADLFHYQRLPRNVRTPEPVRGMTFGFALWPPLIVTALFPGLMIARGMRNTIRRRRRRKRGLCFSCGYDLTGNESGVCPECAWGVTQA